MESFDELKVFKCKYCNGAIKWVDRMPFNLDKEKHKCGKRLGLKINGKRALKAFLKNKGIED